MRALDILAGREDLAAGQAVIVAARWLLVGAGLVLALIAPASASLLRGQILLILLLAVCNFALQAQVLRRGSSIALVAYAASASDIGIITALVATNGGFSSGLYVFYFPAILALSVAFPPVVTALYTGGRLSRYLIVAAATMTGSGAQDLLIRCMVIVAIAICGVVYAGVEARRRRGHLGTPRASDAAAAEVG